MEIAIASVGGCRAAGVFMLEDGRVRAEATSDPLVERVQRLQMQVDEGPCLDAVRSDLDDQVSDDLAVDTAYPSFGPLAVAAGVRSAMGLRLRTDHRLGSMNLYSDLPHAFGVPDRVRAVILASHCSTTLEVAQARASLTETNRADLQAALASRGIIGQAQGILMERERITADQAFAILRHASQDLNVKLRDVAPRLVETGERPAAPSAASSNT